MICQPCRVAGDWASSERRSAYIGSGDVEADRAAVVAYARELHSHCPGHTSCPCQHRIDRQERQ